MTTTVGVAFEADLGDLRSQIAAAREMLRSSSENMRAVLGRGEAAFRSFANAGGLSFAATARSSTALSAATNTVDRYSSALRSSVVEMDRFRAKQMAMTREAAGSAGPVWRVPTYYDSVFLQNLAEAYHSERRMPDGSIQQSNLRQIVDGVTGSISQLRHFVSSTASGLGSLFEEIAAEADKAGGEIASGFDGKASPALRDALGDAADARIAFGGLSAVARVAGVGIALVAGGIAATIPAFIQAAKETQGLEFALRASGNAAGMTVGKVDALAAALAVSTNATRGEVFAAATSLTRFDAVAGPVFGRAITLAKDMAATFGSTTSSEAERLGKALQEPAKALDTLSAAGIAFTSSERALVAGLVDGGNAAQAQTAILDVLQAKVGGNGAAAAGGVAGAFAAASASTADFVKSLLDVSGTSPAIVAALNAVAVAADAVRRSMSGMGQGGYSDERAILDEQIAKAKQEIADLEETAKVTGYRPAENIDHWKARLDDLVASSKALDDANQSAAAAFYKAQDAAKAAAADRQWRETKTTIDGVNSSLDGVATKGEKVAKIREEAAKTVAKLNVDLTLATTDEQRSAIEAAIRTAGEVEKRKIAALEVGGGARSPARGLDGFESAVVSQQVRTAKMVEEAKLLGDNTHALDAYRVKLELEAAAKRSGIPISDQVAARIAKEAASYRAAAVEVDAYKEKIKTADEARSDLKGFTSTFVSDMLHGKSAVESLADAVQRLRDKLADRLEDTILDALLGKSGTPNAGLSGLWGLFSSSSGGVSGQTGFFNLFGLLGKFFGFFAEGGNIPSGGWGIAGEAGPEIIHGPATVIPWADIVGKAPAVSTATAGGFSRSVSPEVVITLARASNAAPDTSARRAVSLATLATAPRFHSGLLSGELPAILLKGESVLNTGLTDRIGGTMSGLADMAANSNYIGGTYAPTIHVNTMGSSGNTTADRQHAAMLKKELRGMLDAHFAESVTRQSEPGGILAGAARSLKA